MTGTEQDLIAAIRELGRVAHSTESDAADRAAVVALIDAATSRLRDGRPRLRWYEADPESAASRGSNRELSTFSGSLNPVAPPMMISAGSMDDGRPALIGTVRLDRLREGPPHAAHGGVIAGLFDELLGGGQRLDGGPPGVTGRLTIRYRRPTPLEADLEFRVWIHDERRRRVTVRGECRVVGDAHSERIVTAEAEAIFLRVDFEKLTDMMQNRVEGETPAPAPPRRRDD